MLGGTGIAVSARTAAPEAACCVAFFLASAEVPRGIYAAANGQPGNVLAWSDAAVKALNPKIVYGSVTGYGSTGPWVDLPGQDLLAQARARVMWLNGEAEDGLVAIDLPIADILAGAAQAHGVLALLFRRERAGIGGQVETSLIEVLADLQFELLTTWFNDSRRMPRRSAQNPAHAYLAAPYGVYRTADGHVAIAMGKLDLLAQITGLDEATAALDAFAERDRIKADLAARLTTRPTAAWMEAFVAADIWAAPVMDWQELTRAGMLDLLELVQEVRRGDVALTTTRLPLRLDGTRRAARRAAFG